MLGLEVLFGILLQVLLGFLIGVLIGFFPELLPETLIQNPHLNLLEVLSKPSLKAFPSHTKKINQSANRDKLPKPFSMDIFRNSRKILVLFKGGREKGFWWSLFFGFLSSWVWGGCV